MCSTGTVCDRTDSMQRSRVARSSSKYAVTIAMRIGLTRGGAPLLGPADRERKDDPAERDGNRGPGDRGQLPAGAAQGGEERAARGIDAAEGHPVDHVFRLVLLLAARHREQDLARGVRDREIRRALDRLES